VGDKGTLLRSTNAELDWGVTHNLACIPEDIVDIRFITRKGDLFHPLRRLSVIVVMQPTQNRTHANSTPCLLRFTWLRNLLLLP
jgi:hypothetical protein